MSVKDTVLQVLEQNRNTFISGQQLADMSGVSRAAIWKAINTLKEQGYSIDSITNKGYRFNSNNDILSSEGIQPYLRPEIYNSNILTYKTLDSTNIKAKQMALEGAPEYTVIIANEQTQGRGRLGRSFYSPCNTGIYMSLILKPQMDIASATLITTASSVAVCKALENVTKTVPSIKWINDIYLNNKKICGILTEAISDFESGTIESIILGIGINVSTETNDFPEELRQTAGSISSSPTVNRNHLIAEILNQIYEVYTNLAPGSYIEEYKSRSMILNQQIYYVKNNIKYNATPIDITETGGLVVQKENGEIETLTSGEVSIRLK